MKLIPAILILFIYNFSFGQSVGSKVSFVAVDGKTYTGSITAIRGDLYSIKYDGVDFKADLNSAQFKVIKPVAAPAPPMAVINPKSTDQPKVVHGNEPTKANLIAWMDKLIAKPASPGMDGAITYELKSFQLGTTRKWQYSDGGNPEKGHNTTIYPIKVHFVQKTHYRTRNSVIDRQCVFTSFKNAFGEWTFGYSSEPRIDKKYEEPSDM